MLRYSVIWNHLLNDVRSQYRTALTCCAMKIEASFLNQQVCLNVMFIKYRYTAHIDLRSEQHFTKYCFSTLDIVCVLAVYVHNTLSLSAQGFYFLSVVGMPIPCLLVNYRVVRTRHAISPIPTT